MRTFIRTLGNRNAGFVLSMVAALNLAAGSVVMDRFPKLYPPFFPNELHFFFEPIRIEHTWLYALLVTFAFFGVNLAACVVDTVIGMAETKTARLRSLAALAFHAALVLVLSAHLYDGIYGNSKRIIVSDDETPVAGLGIIRLKDVQNDYHPDGSLKDTRAKLLLRLTDGQERDEVIAYNEPALIGGGTREVIIQQGGQQPTGLIMTRASDGADIRLMPFEPLPLKKGQLILRGLFESEMGLPVAQFLLQEGGGHRALFMVLDERAGQHARLEIAGERYDYKDVVTTPAAMVVVRYNPSVPLIIGGLLLSALGTVLLLQWMRKRAKY